MSLLTLMGIAFAAYLAAGRVGVVAACLVAGIAPYKIFFIVVFIDFIQIPLYGMILEQSQWHKFIPGRLDKWIQKRSHKIKTRVEASASLKRISKPLAVIGVSLLPLRGFGILSACILAFMLNFNRVYGTFLIMCGSVIGTLLSIVVFYYPARWLDALFA